MVEILTLWSPHKLLKSLGALSEYARCSPSLAKIKKTEILSLYPGFDGMVKKPSHATVPLSKVPVRNFTQCKSTCYFETSWVCCEGAPAFREKCELFMPGTKHTTYLGIYQGKGSWYRVFLGQKRQNYVCCIQTFPGQAAAFTFRKVYKQVPTRT